MINISAIAYGCETWTLNEFIARKLVAAERGMDRSTGHTKKDKKIAADIRQITVVSDIIKGVNTLQWQWAGHVTRRQVVNTSIGMEPSVPRGRTETLSRRRGGIQTSVQSARQAGRRLKEGTSPCDQNL